MPASASKKGLATPFTRKISHLPESLTGVHPSLTSFGTTAYSFVMSGVFFCSSFFSRKRAGTLLLLFAMGMPWATSVRAETSPPSDAELRALPQCKPVTLKVKEKSLGGVLEEISRQAGFLVEGSGARNMPVTLSLENSPFLEALAPICRQGGWNLQEFQREDGRFLKLDENFPIKGFQVRGPLMLAWYDLTTASKYNFDDPKNPVKSIRYRLGLIEDPLGHIKPGGDKPFRDVPVAFLLPDGKRLELNSDHAKNVWSSSEPTWEFEPRVELAGDKVSIEVTVPILAPTLLQKSVVAWTANASAKAGSLNITLETVKEEKKKDFMTNAEFNEFSATFKAIHSTGELMTQIQKENRQPTAEENEKLKGGVLAAHEVWLLGTNGSRVKGNARSASGISSPVHGYRYEAKFKPDKPDFKPKEIEITVAEGFREFRILFKLENVPLTQK